MISASIVTYKNRSSDIEDLIHSIIRSSAISTLFIVDNSPTDDLSQEIDFPKVVYIFSGNNAGYGAGHNIAIKKSIANGCKYHVVVNPDIHLNPDIFENICAYTDLNQAIGNLMPKVYYPDNSIQYLCKLLPTPYDWIGRRFNPFRSLVDKRNNLFELHFTGYKKTMEVPYLSGCFMFLRLDALKKVGLFDENIFMYGEETDLCRRLIIGGYKTVFFPEVSIVHEFQKGSHKSWRLTWIGIKSAIYYFNKWGWFFDKERKMINKLTLQNLGYKK